MNSEKWIMLDLSCYGLLYITIVSKYIIPSFFIFSFSLLVSLVYFSDKFSSKFFLFSYMSRHESLISGNNSYTFTSGNWSYIFVTYIPWSRWLRKEFDIRNIINRINHSFECYVDMFLDSLSYNIKFLNKPVLFEKFQDIDLKIRKRHSFDRGLSSHICVFDSNK